MTKALLLAVLLLVGCAASVSHRDRQRELFGGPQWQQQIAEKGSDIERCRCQAIGPGTLPGPFVCTAIFRKEADAYWFVPA